MSVVLKTGLRAPGSERDGHSTDSDLELLAALPEPPAEFLETLEPGTYLVGIDIRPDRYKEQAGDDITDSCYGARLANGTGDMCALITNDNATGQYYVQIAASDFTFETACPLERAADQGRWRDGTGGKCGWTQSLGAAAADVRGVRE